MNTQEKCKSLLLQHNINTDSNIDFDVNGELHSLDFEAIIDNYMQASAESQLIFLEALQASLSSAEDGAQAFFESMGKLLLMSELSEMPLNATTTDTKA